MNTREDTRSPSYPQPSDVGVGGLTIKLKRTREGLAVAVGGARCLGSNSLFRSPDLRYSRTCRGRRHTGSEVLRLHHPWQRTDLPKWQSRCRSSQRLICSRPPRHSCPRYSPGRRPLGKRTWAQRQMELKLSFPSTDVPQPKLCPQTHAILS